ncbi:MAG: BON domain-containing protein [Rubrobacteraceae bacterium]|nr:BON domain-containing protein [Rubrobacter sp.]
MLGRVAKTAIGTKTGRRAGRKAIKVAVGTPTGRKVLKAGVGVAAKSGKGVVTTRVGRKALGGGAKAAAKAGKGIGKAKLRGGALGSPKPSRTRYMTYGLFALAGFAVGALVARSSKNGDSSSVSSSYTGTTGSHAPDPGSPAGQRGQTWGSGTALGTAGGGTAGQTGSERDYSDPSSGPLIGEERRDSTEGVGEEQPEVEQRIRTAIGEDTRTADMQRVNVAVTDGVAELRGPAPSEEAREAASEIAANVEGVREVRNLIVVE